MQECRRVWDSSFAHQVTSFDFMDAGPIESRDPVSIKFKHLDDSQFGHKEILLKVLLSLQNIQKHHVPILLKNSVVRSTLKLCLWYNQKSFKLINI